MLTLTDHELGPWDVISAEDKRYARVQVLETVIARLEEGMRRAGVEPPPIRRPRWAGCPSLTAAPPVAW